MYLQDLFAVEALLTPCQRLALSQMASGLQDGSVIVEIGPYRGGSTKILHESAPGCELVTIDLYDSIDRDLFDVERHAEFLLGGVAAYREHKGDKPIDFLFIDGDHSFRGVKHDYYTLEANLSATSLIAFHDYSMKYVGVRLFASALIAAGKVEKLAVVDNMLLARFTGNRKPLSAADYAAALETLSEFNFLDPPDDLDDKLARGREIQANLGNYQCIGRGAFGRFVADYFDLEFDTFMDTAAAAQGGHYIICSYWFEEISQQLIEEKGASRTNIIAASELLNQVFLLDMLDGGKRLLSGCEDEDEIMLVRGMASLSEDMLRKLGGYGSLQTCFKHTPVS